MRILVVLACLLLSGCVSTEFYSKANPLYEGAGIRYQRLFVQFIDPQPDYAEFGEKTVKSEVAKTFGPDIQCYLYTDQFYMGASDPVQLLKDIRNFEASKNIDAVLLCYSKRNTTSQSYVTTDPNTHVTLNNSIDDKVAGYRMELIDLQARKSIWFSTAKSDTKFNLVSFKDMMKGFIERSLAQLKKSDLLGKDDRPAPTPADPENPKTEI